MYIGVAGFFKIGIFITMEMDFSNEMIEKLLLKKALNDSKWMNIVSKVFDRRWFKSNTVSVVLDMVIKFYGKYNSMPNSQYIHTLVAKHAERHPANAVKPAEVDSLLAELQHIDITSCEAAVNANIKEFIRRNAFYEALNDNADLLASSPGNYEKVVDKCIENFDRVQKITFNDIDLGLDYFDPVAMEKHWDYIRNPEAKIRTGWGALDTYTNGGFLKEGRSLYLIMAQAGLGKSLFMSNMAVNFLKQGLSVVVISLEMSEDVYAVRFDSHISKKDINHLKENEASAISSIKDFFNQHPDSHLYIKEYPPKSITCNDIQVYLENLKNNGKNFDVVIVDYLNLVKSSTKTDNMFQDGLDVSEKLRALSYMFKVPVISACQVNTEGMNNENVGMENLSQSRGVAFTADFLMALFQTPENRENGLISARLVKNRLGGQIGKVLNFKVNSSNLVLDDVTFNPEDQGEINVADDQLKALMKNMPSLSSDIDDL